MSSNDLAFVKIESSLENSQVILKSEENTNENMEDNNHNNIIQSHFLDPSAHIPASSKQMTFSRDTPNVNIITASDAQKTYNCKKCPFSAHTDAALKYHFIKVHKGRIKMYKCQSCEFITRHKNVMDNHSLIHLSEDQINWLECGVCTFKTKLKCNLEKHEMIHKVSEDMKKYKCTECAYKSLWKRDLERHLLKHMLPDQIVKYGCDKCTFSTKHERYLGVHIQKVHVGEEKSEETFHCAKCDFTTNQKRSLVPHMITHKTKEEINMYKCRFCTYEAAWKKSVRMHEDTHLKVYKCTECEFITRQKRFLNEHLRCHRHVQQTEYACPICPFKTIYKHSIKKHSLVHKDPDEVKMFDCEKCSYRTKRPQDLRQHVKAIHEEITEVFECGVCPYTTKNKNALRIHKRNLHGRPEDILMFECDSCPFRTKYKSSLLAHGQSFHKEHDELSILRCSKCSYSTRRKECLQKHQYVHKTADEVRQLKQAVPFAVCGANTELEVRGRKVKGRLYPWGVVEVENPDHCDFIKLRTMLITHMQDLQEITQQVHYENYRSERLAKENNGGAKKTIIEEKVGGGNEKDKILQEKEAELKRMQEMITAMQAKMQQQTTQ
ncbi:unnamed protein product [Phaedon cochleariae]|uniref:Uncharacterized protein n=1 Tax=Phaedon cochleariae TaxID=80249 RepID=A0A9N9SCZ4_PHACE|nr:unnamed protein product [Phaedon cochleariae]